MKAVVYRRYGPPDVLRLEEVEKPTPAADELLIEVHATTVAPGDCEIRRFDMPWWIWLPLRLYLGFFRPRRKILGMEVAGKVESVGANVTRFKPGDELFGSTGLRLGAHAEYLCLSENHPLEIKPPNLTFEQVAPLPVGGMNAVHFIRKAAIQPGETVLINGACGNIGTYAVQLATHLGAEVTAVDGPDKLERLREIGAAHVIDYTREDFTRGDKRYDVIFDVVGKAPYRDCIRTLADGGRLLIAVPRVRHIFLARWTSMTTDKRAVIEPAGESADDIAHLKQWIEAGTLRAVIDKRYSLDRVPEAHVYVESGLKQGHVVVNVVPALADGDAPT